jgi:hypothetical protein
VVSIGIKELMKSELKASPRTTAERNETMMTAHKYNRSFRLVTPGPAPQWRSNSSPCGVLAGAGCRPARYVPIVMKIFATN